MRAPPRRPRAQLQHAKAAARSRHSPRAASQAAEITALRAALGSALPATWDDIWLLRYCLSFVGKPARQESAARSCIAWRAKNAELLTAAKEGRPLPTDAVIKIHCVTDYHGSTKLGEPVNIVRAGLCSPPGLLAVITPEQFLEWLMYKKEAAFLQCDAVTRERRVLAKCITVVDLSGTSLMSASSAASIKCAARGVRTSASAQQNPDASRGALARAHTRADQKIIGESGKISEEVYPQLLGKQVLMHPPRFFAAMFSIIRQFMSEKVVEKLGFCPGSGEAHGTSAGVCPYASQRFEVASLPTFLGGNCRCTALGGCICGTPNERTSLLVNDGERTVTVGARAKHEVHMTARVAGARLMWGFSIADKGLEFNALFTPEQGAPVMLAFAKKYRAEDGNISGEALIPGPGSVCVTFDNSHSRFTSKTLTYNVTVVAPADAADDAVSAPVGSAVAGAEGTPAQEADDDAEAAPLAEAVADLAL